MTLLTLEIVGFKPRRLRRNTIIDLITAFWYGYCITRNPFVSAFDAINFSTRDLAKLRTRSRRLKT